MNKYSKKEIEKVKHDLLSSKIVALPTDTVFGLACIKNDKKAEEKIYEAKKRSISKKLPMMVSNYKMLKKYCEVNNEVEKLIKTFTPGPITLILKYIDSEDTVAVRIPNDDWIIKLIDELNKPLSVTSANISNTNSLIKYEDVVNQIGNKIDAIIEGDAKGEKSSTIVDCVNDYKIIRDGPISEGEIRRVLNREDK